MIFLNSNRRKSVNVPGLHRFKGIQFTRTMILDGFQDGWRTQFAFAVQFQHFLIGERFNDSVLLRGERRVIGNLAGKDQEHDITAACYYSLVYAQEMLELYAGACFFFGLPLDTLNKAFMDFERASRQVKEAGLFMPSLLDQNIFVALLKNDASTSKKCHEASIASYQQGHYENQTLRTKKVYILICRLNENPWQGRQDSNLRHPVLETGALPTELLPYVGYGAIIAKITR